MGINALKDQHIEISPRKTKGNAATTIARTLVLSAGLLLGSSNNVGAEEESNKPGTNEVQPEELPDLADIKTDDEGNFPIGSKSTVTINGQKHVIYVRETRLKKDGVQNVAETDIMVGNKRLRLSCLQSPVVITGQKLKVNKDGVKELHISGKNAISSGKTVVPLDEFCKSLECFFDEDDKNDEVPFDVDIGDIFTVGATLKLAERANAM